ncbi:hypothetical protein NLJ89_g9865 [Agrocybe chaxingu]|uniref:Uncharacterized protein n=1 Tax=Agrocybe chaxingu TaxID=84603 RepID=A0A9W8MQT7_9AGAR|nr:hypothetical protein NLJ89_g9865 [Agrocybe chaxingu]
MGSACEGGVNTESSKELNGRVLHTTREIEFATEDANSRLKLAESSEYERHPPGVHHHPKPLLQRTGVRPVNGLGQTPTSTPGKTSAISDDQTANGAPSRGWMQLAAFVPASKTLSA